MLVTIGAAGLSGCGGETTGTGGITNGAGATDSGGSAGCPGTGGPTMVMLPEGYCIDSTVVTVEQYQTWLDMSPALPNPSDADCGWNTSFTPTHDWPYNGTRSDYPMVNVDWCDAYAYCQGVRKRLCGKIGSGSNGYNDYANALASQWYNACSSHGRNTYPYGNTYHANACNGWDHGVRAAVPVASLSECQSSDPGYDGVYDLSGNVWEWEDSCTGTGQAAYCHLRGGSFRNPDDGTLACGFDDSTSPVFRSNTLDGIGFRCCS